MMKHSRGRPKKIDDVSKSNTINKKEIVECILCYKTFDLNSRLQEQRIINDTKFCASCFYEILNQEYQQQAKDVYDMRINLLTNASTLDAAMKFISDYKEEDRQQQRKQQKEKQISVATDNIEKTETEITTNQVF